MKSTRFFAVPLLAIALTSAYAQRGTLLPSHSDAGFVSLFDGETLNGWTEVNGTTAGYRVESGAIVCTKESAANLFSEKDYTNYILRLDFKLTSNANNGIAIQAPFEKGQIAYIGNEIQVLDDPTYPNLLPSQYCGSRYKITPAKRGALKPTGQWNHYEITVKGRHIKVALNGKLITDSDPNTVTDPEVIRAHPGMFRTKGRVGFLGHHSRVEFKNISIKELPSTEQENTAPEGFTTLFNGRDLTGWKGLLKDPPHRAKMSPQELATEQKKADEIAFSHWHPKDGQITFDGDWKGQNLCTIKDYGDFEMLVDWKIPPRGDSGIYLRGSPQVQIWATNSPGQFNPPDGSGGLYNNNINPRHPLKYADHPVGEWNRFRIIMVGDKVHVFLNDVLVVNNTTMENYWERNKPIYPTGSLELQNHGGPLGFKNIYVREIPHQEK
ncbi:MAG: 3-keto-disaccharide hydrolase [Limisphaerales bacterium]